MTQTRLDNNDEPKPQRLYSTEMKPWYTHLTLDLIVHVLSRSIFHPAIVLIFYLCLAGLHKHRSPTAYYTLYYAACLAVIEILIWGNRRLTYGRARNVDWSQEVVLVTGGGRGLGRIIVESLVRRGVRIGVLELCEKGEGVNELEDSYDLCWEKCDVSKADQVERAIGKIVDEVSLHSVHFPRWIWELIIDLSARSSDDPHPQCCGSHQRLAASSLINIHLFIAGLAYAVLQRHLCPAISHACSRCSDDGRQHNLAVQPPPLDPTIPHDSCHQIQWQRCHNCHHLQHSLAPPSIPPQRLRRL